MTADPSPGDTNDSRDAFDKVIHVVTEAFALVDYPGDDRITSLTPGDLLYGSEYLDCLNAFKGKHWRELTVGFVEKHHWAMSFLTPRAMHFYLPAFILATVQNPQGTDNIGERLLYSLTGPFDIASPERDRWIAFANYFTHDQTRAVACFLKLLRDDERFSDLSTWNGPQRALKSYWLGGLRDPDQD